MKITEFGRRCPIDYKDGWAIHYRSEEDAYKIYMFIPQLQYHSNDITTYVYNDREHSTGWSPEMFAELQRQFDHLAQLKWTDAEIEYLLTIPHLKPHKGSIELLRHLTLDKRYLKMWLDENNELHIEAEGPVYIVSQFEIYTLSIVSYVWNLAHDTYENIYNVGVERWANKLSEFAEGGKYVSIKGDVAEFGTRRRNLPELQEFIVVSGTEAGVFSGTSNMYLAMKYGIKPIGTFAHEYPMLFQGQPGVQLAYTNKYAMDEWLKCYNGDLGIALTDTLTTKLFLKDFKRLMMRQFMGVRTDSGDDYYHVEEFIKAYTSEGVDPKTKTFLVSNAYDFDKAVAIKKYINGRMKFAAGIGTFITNDSTVKPMNIVMKLQKVNGKPVAKISDDQGKAMCQSPAYTAYLKSAIQWRLENEE